MKTIFTILLTAFTISAANAQQPDKVLARVRYNYTNNTDTLKNGKLRSENMLLFIGKNASLYTSYDRLNFQLAMDQKIRAKMTTMIDNGKPQSFKIDQSESDWMTTTNQLNFFKENKHFIKEIIVDINYIVEEKIPIINWTILKDTMSLSGISCQKAIAKIDDKNWIAWFAPHLPFQAGPWQLHGLPGLIIQVHDEQNDANFIFAGIENVNDEDFKRTNDITKGINKGEGLINAIDIMLGFDVAEAYYANNIKLPEIYTTKTTKEKLAKFKEAYKQNPKAFKNK